MSKYFNKKLIGVLAISTIACIGGSIFANKELAQAENVYINKDDYVYLLDYYHIADYNSECTVINANGKTVSVDSQGTFLATTPGVYTIIDEKNDVKTTLYCKIDREQATLKLQENLMDSYAVAENMQIPRATIQTQYATYSISSFDIEYKGNLLVQDEVMSGDFYTYRPLLAGEYTIQYHYNTLFGEELSIDKEFVVADTPAFIFDKYKENASVGYSIKPSDISFSYGGEIYVPELSIEKGNNKQNIYSTYIFNEVGTYTISAVYVVDGESFTYEKPINIDYSYANYFTGEGFTSDENIDAQSFSVSANGVSIVPSSATASAYYVEKINLNDFSKGESLIEFQTLNNEGFLDKIRVELIDAYDPYNKISVYWWQTPGWPQLCYMLVEHGTVARGRSNETWLFGEARDTYGALIGGYSLNGAGQTGRGLFNFSFDIKSGILYTNGATNMAGDYDVLNLHSAVDMGSGKEFKGFTTGEVFLRINFCNQQQGGVLVTKVAGKSLSGEMVNVPINQTCFDVLFDGDSLVNGIVGYDYKLPEIYSDNLALGKVKVDFDITQNGQSYLSDVSDGYFRPTKAGTYLLTYSAVDNFQQICKKEFELVVAENPKEIYCVEKNANRQPQIMEKYKFDYALSGGYGELKKEISYRLNGKVLTIDELGYVFVDEGGNLEISVLLTDYNNYSKVYTFNKAVSTNRVLFNYKNNQFPSVIRSGERLTLPELTYVDYKTGLSGKAVCFVDDEKISNNTITIPDGKDKIVVKYVANAGTEREAILEREIRVEAKQATVVDMLSYDKNVFSTMMIGSGIVLETNATKYDGSAIAMPYALATRDMLISFSINENMKEFETIELFLEAYNNPSNVVKVTLYKDNEGSKIRINNDSVGYIIKPGEGSYTGNQGVFTDVKYEKYTLIFDCWSNKFLTHVGNEIVQISKNLAGETFKGFDDNQVKFSLKFTGVSGKCGITLNEVNKQLFSDYLVENYTASDNAGPSLCLSGNLQEKADYQVGSQVVIPFATACDVLQFYTDITLTVIQGSKVIYEKLNPQEDYVLTLSEKGKYTIFYKTADALGNSKKYQFVLNSCDTTNPVITVEGTYANAHVGDTITILNCAVQDESNVDVVITLVDSTGTFRVVNAKDKIKLRYSGTYYVSYFAIDAEGNSTNYQVEFNVEA